MLTVVEVVDVDTSAGTSAAASNNTGDITTNGNPPWSQVSLVPQPTDLSTTSIGAVFPWSN